MSEPFMAEIKVISFNFAPKGWALANGQLLPINQNQALFSILGTTYGGDGMTNFALPNLQGRMPVHAGNGIVLGEQGGEASHTLVASEMPVHTHSAGAHGGTGGAPAGTPVGNTWNYNSTQQPYSGTANTTMNPAAVASVGGGQPHDNTSPYLVLNFVIALTGIFPSRS